MLEQLFNMSVDTVKYVDCWGMLQHTTLLKFSYVPFRKKAAKDGEGTRERQGKGRWKRSGKGLEEEGSGKGVHEERRGKERKMERERVMKKKSREGEMGREREEEHE
jgi:hypothetical protein